MKSVAMCVVLCSSALAWAAPPRVVVQPLAATIPLPGAANAALLSTLASLAIELPSSFEVEDALATVPAKTCAEDVRCLAGLARATTSRWALAVAFQQREDLGRLSAQVVDAEGVLARPVETLELSVIPATGEAWAEVFRELAAKLRLESLGTEPAPLVMTVPVSPPSVEPVVAAPPRVEVVRAAPSLRQPVALVAGLVAVGAGCAALALAVTNLREASALDGAMRSGLIPGDTVDRAVALDERTAVATALGIGAGVAAAVAVGALLMKDAPVQLAPSAGPGGAGLTLSGRLP